MDNSKKAAFVKAMGKRAKFSKGGMIRKIAGRHYFDDGGTVAAQNLTTLGGPGSGGVSQNAANPNTGVLGTISGALGLNNNFQATGANIQQGTNNAQLNQAYTGAQQGLTDQSGLVGSLNPQVAGAVQNQNALAGQLFGMTQGQGPNPAQMELAQATANNVAQTGAQMAGARGSSGNVGLLARQIGQQGAATQQAAAGQAATLEAQQQIAAQQNLANLANTQVGQATGAVTNENQAQQNEQNTLQNANTAANNAAVGMQSNINNTNAQTAAGNQGVLGSVLGGVGSAVSGLAKGIGSIFGAEGGVVGPNGFEKDDHIKMAEMNAASIAHGRKMLASGGPIVGNPLLGNQNTPQAQSFVGQYISSPAAAGPNIQATPSFGTSGKPADLTALGSAIGAAATPEEIQQGTPDMYNSSDSPTVSQIGTGQTGFQHIDPGYAQGGKVCTGPHRSHVANYMFADGGKVKAMVSPGEVYLSPDKVQRVIREGVDPLRVGHKFNGKAKVKGDSLKNDIIPADLEEGGVVIDRKNMKSRESRELFVHRAIARKKARA